MNFRFQVYQWIKNSEGKLFRNCWRTSRTFEGAMKEASFSKKEIAYAKIKKITLSSRFILDTLTGEITEVKP